VRIVIALGGNALLRRGQRLDARTQQANARRAAHAIAEIARRHDVVVTHGNGPQVGLLALNDDAFPLDVLDAETEGMIGYVVEQELRNAEPGREVATLLTQVVVDPADPAFAHPTKPVGPVYGHAEGRRLADANGWAIAADGRGFRRVVASPRPVDIVGVPVIRLLLDAGVLVVCAGGGGIPVTRDHRGLHGVEAVVDKDRTAALLARRLEADRLLLLTDVDGVWLDRGTPSARRIDHATPDALRRLALDPGSMGPKAEAACDFVDTTGGVAVIGALEDAVAMLDGPGGRAGTRVAAASRAA